VIITNERAATVSAGDCVTDPFSVALRRALLEIPYNSATQFHTYFGSGSPDSKFGAACIIQSIEVARLAVSLGASSPVLLQDERHVAAVFETDNELVVLDPYLLHGSPVRFSREEMAEGRATKTVAALPRRYDTDGQIREGRLTATYKATNDGYAIRLVYSRYSPTKDQYVLSRHFTLRSTNSFDMSEFTSDLRGLMTDPEQTSVSIRAVLPDLSGTAEAILPLNGFATNTFTRDDIWVRNSQGAMLNSDRRESTIVWRQLEECTHLTQWEVEDHLLSAAGIYQTIANPSREVAPYRLENE
jgi:hypothetical protein